MDDPRLQALAVLPRTRELVELNGRLVGMLKIAPDNFIAVRPHNLTELEAVLDREFYYGEARYRITAVEPLWDDTWREREARLSQEHDLRKRQALKLALERDKAAGPTFIRLRASYSGGGPQ